MTDGVTQRAQASPQPRDPKAIEREALAHSGALYRLAARLMGSIAEAEDVVQEAFIKAISELRRGGFRGDSSLSTWLYRVLTNVALDRLRQAKRQQANTPEVSEASTASPDAAVALRELADAMKELPEDQRAALVLKEVQGLPTREVASILERSEGATEQLLVRARQTLRRRFEP
jgi:RNA polymerase sigma-70 factor (ECF subfamily)